jgi:WD40 repeat protein
MRSEVRGKTIERIVAALGCKVWLVQPHAQLLMTREIYSCAIQMSRFIGKNYRGVKNMKQLAPLTICLSLILAVAQLSAAQKPELVVQTGHSASVDSVAFSPDGRFLASSGKDGTIKLWDVSTGTELRTLTAHSSVDYLTFNPDGKTLASGSLDGMIRLWDVSTGTQLRIFAAAFAFSPDWKTLARGSRDDITLKPDEVPISKIELWDVATGIELRTINEQDVNSLTFSPDGKILAIDGADYTIKLWDVSTGRPLRTLTGANFGPVVFSRDGKILAGRSINSTMRPGEFPTTTIKLWDVASGTELRTLTGHSPRIYSVAFSPDGKTIASGVGGGADGMSGTIRLWDVSINTEVRTLIESGWVTSVAFSPDGKILASGTSEWDSMIKFWNVPTGAVLGTYGPVNSVFGFSVAFSPDGNTLAAGSSDKTVKLLGLATATSRTLAGHSDLVTSVAFSPDGKTLASGSWDTSVKLWDISTGIESRTLGGNSGWVSSVAFSPDGKTLAGSFHYDTNGISNAGSNVKGDVGIKLWDVSTGAVLRTLAVHSGSVYSVAFSPDGRILAGVSADYTVRLWDVSTGKELRTLAANNPIAFSPKNNYLVSGNEDSSIKIWDVASGRELASLIPFGERDWIVVTPDGLFDGSPVAWNQILWRFNNTTLDYASVEAFYNEFYYPGLLADIFAGKHPKAPSDISQKDRRQPQLKLTLAAAQSDALLTTRNVTVKINVSQAPAGAQDVRLFRNGSLVRVWHGDVLKGQKSATLAVTIPIVAGGNKLTAYAFNHDNIKSSDATLVVNGADSLKRPGMAYVLAVGVNSYSNPNYNLKYAVADAEDFCAEFKRQQEMLKKYERIEVIPLYDKQATKAQILQTLSQLATKAQPEDVVIVYFSGHGTARKQRFYLIPSELGYQGERTKLSAKDLQTILQHSISDRELEAAFEGIDAGQLLLVIDACNSGQALDAEEKRRGPMNSKGLAQLAYEKGMYILTAAQSYQAALEASRIGHGYLTYALVEEGLRQGKADRQPQDKQIVLREWLDYATERVPQMQEEKLKETPQVKDQQGRELEFVFVEGDESIKDPANRSVQKPRVFYRRETESLPMIVARPQTIPSEN